MPLLPRGPCLRCFLSSSPTETCSTAGVLNTTTSLVAAYQTAIVLKMIVNGEENVDANELLHINAWENILRKIKVNPKKNCPVCQGKDDPLLQEEEIKSISFCSKARFQITGKEKDFTKIQQQWEKVGEVSNDGETISFHNIVLFKDGRALIKANSEEEARAVYDQYIGN